jgi:selenocysteine-specific translation elongation factor
MTTEEQIGVVSNYFDHVGVAAIKLTGDVKIGDVIKFVGGEVDYDMPVESIQVHKDKVESAKAGDEIGIKVKEKVRKEYKVFRVDSSE